MNVTHIFENSGLGKAPYQYAGCTQNRSVCQYCGTIIRYQFWLLSSDGRKFFVGSDCINKSGDSGLMYHVKKERSKISKEKRAIKQKEKYEARQAAFLLATQEKLQNYLSNHTDIAHIFEWAKNSSGVPLDLYNNLLKWGSLTDSQLKFLTNLYEDTLVTKQPCPIGKVTIEGVVLKIKSVLTQFGYTNKMIVESEQGYRVYGSIPGTVDYPEIGTKIRFNATVERSKDDSTFGFFKRPTQATILS